MLERQEDQNSALTEHMITPLMQLLQQVPQNAKAEKVLELVQKLMTKLLFSLSTEQLNCTYSGI